MATQQDLHYIASCLSTDCQRVFGFGDTKEQAINEIKNKGGTVGMIKIECIDLIGGKTVAVEYVAEACTPEQPCGSTQCEKCHIELPLHPAFKAQDYRDPGFYMSADWEPEPFDPVEFIEELYDTTIDEYNARLQEQLSYVRANATDCKRQQLLKEGLR